MTPWEELRRHEHNQAHLLWHKAASVVWGIQMVILLSVAVWGVVTDRVANQWGWMAWLVLFLINWLVAAVAVANEPPEQSSKSSPLKYKPGSLEGIDSSQKG